MLLSAGVQSQDENTDNADVGVLEDFYQSTDDFQNDNDVNVLENLGWWKTYFKTSSEMPDENHMTKIIISSH